jgi:chitodextrinase
MTAPARLGSVGVGAYSLEVATLGGSFAQFEPEQEAENARALEAALEEEPRKPPAAVAALEQFEETADAVTGRIEQADKLLRTAAAGKVLDLDNVTGEIDGLLDLFARLDRAGRFEEELKLMRSLNGLLALTLRWLDLIRSLRSLLRSAEAAGHTAGKAFAHHELGSLNLCAGRAEEAQRHLREAFRLQSELGDLTGQCATRHNLDSARRDAVLARNGGPPRRLLRSAVLASTFVLLGGGGGTGLAFAIRGGDHHSKTGSTESRPVAHTLTVKRAGKGNGSVSGGVACPGSCETSVEDGQVVTLRAKEAKGSIFAGWKGVDCLRRKCAVTVRADLTVTAVFQPHATGDLVQPTAPTGLQAKTVSESAIDLSWTDSTDNVEVTGYVIYRNGQRVQSVRGTSFRDTRLAPATVYRYTIRATDAARNLSSPSNEKSAKTLAVARPDVEPPTTPTNVSADAISSSEIVITWSLSTDNVGVLSYVIYRDDKMVDTIPYTEASYHDTELDYSTTYTYVIVALDAAGNPSPKSDPPAEAMTGPG